MAAPLSEDDEATLEQAQDAAFIHGAVGPYIRRYIDTLVRKMVSQYRGGNTSHDLILGMVAEISALLLLIDDLESVERRANSVREKHHDEEAKSNRTNLPQPW